MKQKVIAKPKQKRSVITKSKIKKAARALFSEHGYYKVTSNMIAAEAQVPIGSFYNYFGNKKGVLLELIKDFNKTFHEASLNHFVAEDLEFSSIEEVLPIMEQMLTMSLLHSNLADPFYKIIHSLQFTEPDVLALSEDIRGFEIDLLSSLLEKVSTFHPIENIPLKAKLIHSHAENIGLYINHLGTTLEKEDLIKETVLMAYKYLFTK